jgi:hypothetical protein
MTFVELCDMVRREGGISGPSITTVQGSIPTETTRVKNWVKDAWQDIQSMHTDWQFLFYESSFTIPQYASLITPTEFAAGVVAEWTPWTARISSADEGRAKSQELTLQNYYIFRDSEGLDPTVRGRPSTIAIHPRTEAIHLAPAADAEYEFYYDYYRTPQILDQDEEEPVMPARFHALIAWEALSRYGGYEVAPDVVSRAREHAGKLMAALISDQMPGVSTSCLDDGRAYGW